MITVFNNILEKITFSKLLIIILLLLLLLFKLTFTIGVSKSSSMEPTIYKLPFKPERGDIISFSKFKDFDNNTTIDLGKRIVALTGDKIYIKNNELYIRPKEGVQESKYIFNGEKYIKEPYPFVYRSNPNVDTNWTSPNVFLKNVLPKNCIYVMGDNRNYSMDSRIYGCVDPKDIKGLYL